MKTITRTLISVATVALMPAIAVAQKATYDFDADQNFASLRTFSFRDAPIRQTLTEQTTTYDDPFVRQRTNDAIAMQLERRGMRRNDEAPDVYVTTRRTFRTEYVVYPADGYGYGWGWGYGYGPAYTEPIIKGTLIVDLTDADTGQLVWRGVGERTVHPMSSPEHRTKRVNREVEKIFKNFPPPGAIGTSGER